MTTLQMPDPATHTTDRRATTRPRLGFAGVGWIGRHRLQAVLESDLAEIVAAADTVPELLEQTAALVPGVRILSSFEALLDEPLDGVVIATPSALHAAQAQAALERGFAVFCQKPLARTADETRQIVNAARKADRLLSVDFSYRFVRGVEQMRELIQSGELGDLYAADLTFHNAYGPDKAWFYDPKLSGGGCVIDLGTHLVDLALWMFGFPRVAEVRSRLYRGGKRLNDLESQVEDSAWAEWTFENGASARLACSWKLPAGQDAVIEAMFYGTRGAVALRNVNGSFYEFLVEHCVGTSRRRLAEPPEAWGGRAIVDWVARLGRDRGFDPRADEFNQMAALLDRIYQR